MSTATLEAAEKKQSLKIWLQELKNRNGSRPNFFRFFLLVVQRLCSGFLRNIIYITDNYNLIPGSNPGAASRNRTPGQASLMPAFFYGMDGFVKKYPNGRGL